MAVTSKNLSDTKVQLSIVADKTELTKIKEQVLRELGRDTKLAGFRAGKAPLNLLERQLDPQRLQTQFLDEAINQLYVDAAKEKKLRPVAQPEVSITKFVPFDTLELTATVDVVGDIVVPDYKQLKIEKKPVHVTAKDVERTLQQLHIREAKKKEVKRAAKDGDEVTIDFAGHDSKTDQPIAGADGKAYPLVLGSNSFIPGFEPELIGLKAGEQKSFSITFPKDYGVSTLQSRKVTFSVTVAKVQELTEPKLDDAFASTVGPFKTLIELKADIKKQLQVEQERQVERDYENQLVQRIAETTQVALPEAIVEDQIKNMEQEERQNLTYRGQTWEEHLKDEGVTEEEHHARLRPDAEQRVKAGLALSEIAEQENITVSREELEVRLQLLKGQYADPQMQAELDKPENRQDIFNRLVTEKTLEKLNSYVTARAS